MRKLLCIIICCSGCLCIFAGFNFPWGVNPGGGDATSVNKLPDYIPPSPEASSIFQAKQLSINYSSGSPNIMIPLGELSMLDYKLGISLSYNSTGVKVDDYASNVGMGWNVNFGAVISRVIFDKPDENRDANNNLNVANINTLNAATLSFLKSVTNDKESDIFTLTLPNFSGKFILNVSNQPVFLVNNNYKIDVINSSFINGFVVTDDNGVQYYFEAKETSQNRNPTGSNCEKNYDAVKVITSWYVSKIVHPSTRKQINFVYDSASVTTEQAISQTISKVTSSEEYECAAGDGPAGFAYVIGDERFSTCIPVQTITTKFISKIATSDGDSALFTYDATSRTDLQGSKRLSGLVIKSRYQRVIKNITFTASYQTAVTSAASYRMKRMFLEKVSITNILTGNAAKKMDYVFKYNDYAALPARLSYGQDLYGYYNGKNSNPSLLPKLPSTDINYATFENGNGADLVNFGDRGIDTAYAIKGLLSKIIYPTGGYDTLLFRPNRYLVNSTETLAGGNSVFKIISYAASGTKAREKTFIYRFKNDNSLSALLLNQNPRFSQLTTVQRDGYSCNHIGNLPQFYFEGPKGTYAVVTSNTIVPLTALGGQHLYHQSVLEYETGATTTNGMTEHKFMFFAGGVLSPRAVMGNYILNCPYQVADDITLGENVTNVYKGTSSANYTLLKSKQVYLRLSGLSNYSSYVVKQNFNYTASNTPPTSDEFHPFDVMEVYINTYTLVTDSVVEKDYSNTANPLTVKQEFYYENTAYPYPTKIKTYESDGSVDMITRKYPEDYASAYSYMISKNILAPVIEERKYKDNVLLTSSLQTFSNWFNDGKNIVLQSSEIKRDSTTQMGKIIFSAYDTLNNVKELSKVNDMKISYIWDYKGAYPVAKITNALAADIAYTSFEGDGKGGWAFTKTPVADITAPTGTKSYLLSTGNTISKTGFNAAKTYIVSYWSKNTSAYTVTGSTNTIIGKTVNGWKYFEHTVSGVSTITLSGSGSIDEVRMYPSTAQMTTYTYEPMVGITSQCDANNRVTYFDYDDMVRLKMISDQDRNVVKYFCYNYAGEVFNCDSVSNVIYYNRTLSQVFTRNNCGTGYTAGQVEYIVAAFKYTSTISQADADQKALDEISNNGQTYANTNGTCTATATCTSCSGVDKKCINGVCTTGAKIYISSVQIGPHLYECTYYYKWSDGSTSGNYTEQSPTPCSVTND